MKKRFLIFCDFYLPGFKSGGGVWTLVNLVDRFADQYDFFIVTRNYDSKGDTAAYTTVATDVWNEVENAQVFYFSPGSLSVGKAAELFREVGPDAVFLNSAFSMPGMKLLTARRKRLVPQVPVIVAPCGELSERALSLKPLKKKLFLTYAKLVGHYNGVIWKASFDAEEQEIRDVLGNDIDVMIAPDLVPRSIIPEYSQDRKPFKEEGSAKFVFISRIVPKKNLSFFLELLEEISAGSVEFEIIGPPEDPDYWRQCRKLIGRLPENIKVAVSGSLPWKEALSRAFDSHFFVLPTLNENFGYVFLEGLSAGCPLLISDQNVWTDVDEKGLGWRIPLDRPHEFLEQIKKCIAMDNGEFTEISRRARDYAVEWIARPEINEATARVLSRALDDNARSVSDGR